MLLEQAAFKGLSSLCPFSRSWASDRGSTPAYGAFPPLKISQQVIPNDHYIAYKERIYWMVLWIQLLIRLATAIHK